MSKLMKQIYLITKTMESNLCDWYIDPRTGWIWFSPIAGDILLKDYWK